MDAARASDSGVLVLSGGPGIGKSALCAWAIAHATGPSSTPSDDG
jgi:predicted ATPase